MTVLYVAGATLTAIVLAILLVPLLRRTKPAAPRGGYDLRVYRDQLAELGRDRERGLIGAAEADAAATEIKRRILGADTDLARPANTAPAARTSRMLTAAGLVLVIPLAAAALYGTLGRPTEPDQPLAERSASELAGEMSPAERRQLDAIVGKLEARLEAQPNDVQGWFLLGRSYLTLGRYPDAATAFKRALDLRPDNPDLAGAYAEALIAAANGDITPDARKALERVLAFDPYNPQARYLLAVDQGNRGDLPGAVQGLVDLIALAPPDAPWLDTVREALTAAAQQAGIDTKTVTPSPQIGELLAQRPTPAPSAAAPAPPPAADRSAPPGPSAEDMAAAQQMSPEQRAEMIRSMVDRLAARLHDNPDDLAGWQRLARAYTVLGETDKARDAEEHVRALQQR